MFYKNDLDSLAYDHDDAIHPVGLYIQKQQEKKLPHFLKMSCQIEGE